MIDRKLILTDCDGVLLDWDRVFVQWMAQRGYAQVRDDVYGVASRFDVSKEEGRRLSAEFNNSAAIRYLPPIPGAVEGVRRIVQQGYKLRVITSLSTDPWAVKAREDNLREVFGTDAFDKIICLDTGADKDEELELYAASGLLWLEDKPANAYAGRKVGLTSVLLEQKHTVDFNDPVIFKARDWRDIVNAVYTLK